MDRFEEKIGELLRLDFGVTPGRGGREAALHGGVAGRDGFPGATAGKSLRAKSAPAIFRPSF